MFGHCSCSSLLIQIHDSLSVVPAKAGTQYSQPLQEKEWCRPYRFCTNADSTVSTGSPEFTNEVQHLLREVLPWGASTSSCHWTTDARLPGFKPMDKRSGKSLQLWIARHRPSLAR